MRDAASAAMLAMKDANKLLKTVLRALPALPYLAPKKTSSLTPFLLGALGAAIVGGVAAVLVFSPRTRYRALDIAKDGYGKVKGQIAPLTEKLFDNHTPTLNETANASSYSTTGS